jgi:triacylglycerol lipase
VLSITTIATPHRGSSFADHFLETIGKTRIPSVVSFLDMLPNGGGDGKAFECLTVENSRQFNESTPDVPDVRYYSWGAVYEPGLIDTWKYVIAYGLSSILTHAFLSLVQVATFCDRRERRPQ